jgi:hypothetical protein
MKHLAKIFIVLVLAICLPLEGVAAATMSLCESQTNTTHSMSMQAKSASMDHCNHGDKQHGIGHNKQKPEKSSCDKSSCSLCAAQAFLSSILPSVVSVAADALSPRFEINKPQSISTLFFRPPITALA